MSVFFALCITGMAVIVLFNRHPVLQKLNLMRQFRFYSKGREAGFSFAQIKVLRELANRTKIPHPDAIFWSKTQIDTCIKLLVKNLSGEKAMDTQENQQFLHKIFELRKRMELELPRGKRGITDSRDMSTLQSINVVVSGAGVFKSKILENKNASLTIERPDSSALPVDFVWKGKKVVIYFSRKEDASYCFDSSVLSETAAETGSTLLLTHSNYLHRTQFRASIRAVTHRAAYLYPAGIADMSERPAVISQVNCFLEDFSDTGFAITVGGTLPEGCQVVVQFSLAGEPLNLSGTVRKTLYHEQSNTSRLNVQADIMPLRIRNLIMSVVLGAIEDDADIIPFSSKADIDAEIAVPPKPREQDVQGKPRPPAKSGFTWDG